MQHLEYQPDAVEVAATAGGRGARTHRVDGYAITDQTSALTAIAAALSFPAYFGHNLDALYDCLTDLSWLPTGEHVLIWSHPDRMQQAQPRAYAAVLTTLSDAVAATGRGGRLLRVVLTDR